MEKLFFNLAENEFTKERKILLWIFAAIFMLAGLAIIFMNVIQHDKAIAITYAIAPFGISLAVGSIAVLATRKEKDTFFLVDDEKIEYKFGMFKPVKITHSWVDITEVIIPHKEKRVKVIYKDNSPHLINLNWIEKKKTHLIRKHIFCLAKEKNILVTKVTRIA